MLNFLIKWRIVLTSSSENVSDVMSETSMKVNEVLVLVAAAAVVEVLLLLLVD